MRRDVKADQASLAAQQVKRAVDHDPVQPWRKGPALIEPAERGEGPLERVLDDVIGHIAPAADRPRKPPRPTPVPLEQHRRCVTRAAMRTADQFAVRRLNHRHKCITARNRFCVPGREPSTSASGGTSRSSLTEERRRRPRRLLGKAARRRHSYRQR